MDQMDQINEIDETENVGDVEDVGDVGDVEDVEDAEDAEGAEDAEDAEEMDESDDSDDSEEMGPFDEYGDAILQVGHGDEFLVSSASLSDISPVFEQMFHSRSHSRQPLSDVSILAIRLDKDKSKPIKYICCIAHEQEWKLPEELSLDALADFAAACRTYQCQQNEIVIEQSKLWFKKALEAEAPFKYEKLLFVAYVLDLPEEFMQVTQILTRDVSDSLNIEPATCNTNLLSMSLLDELIEAKAGVVQDIDEAVRDILFQPEICDGRRLDIANTMLAINRAHFWPVGRLCIRQVLLAAKNMDEIKISHCHNFECENCNHPDDYIKERLVKALQKIYDNVKGRCLDCFYETATGEVNPLCRVEHERETDISV